MGNRYSHWLACPTAMRTRTRWWEGRLARTRHRRWFFSSRRRHTRYWRDWSSDVCSSDLALASLVGGFAESETTLIAARAVQGLGAALVSPAALSIVTTMFREGAERNKALAVWGAVAGSGGAAGVLAGGVLTEYLGWEWVLWVNVPIGLAAAFAAPVLLAESTSESETRTFDVAGAV